MSSDMKPLTSEEIQAARIVAKHDVMTANGERRFRLQKEDDGTAYIRTEASNNGGWQNSHHHDHCTETYIVQSGWMAAAELRDGEVMLTRYQTGQIYSTEAGVVHNIYLPAGAVIHTVKHGPAAKGDWHGNTPGAITLNEQTKSISESQITARASAPRSVFGGSTTAQSTYSDSYRHFDNLIWQVPVWSSAVFAIAAASLPDNSVLLTNLTSGSGSLREFSWIAAFWTALYGMVWLALFVFMIALYRFRRRQGAEALSWIPFFKSASFWSMALVTMEAALFLAITLVTAGLENALATTVALAFAVIGIVGSEVRMHRSPQLVVQRHS